jgi:N utilization substance protein B
VSARTKARKRALDILYVADVRQISIAEALAAEAERAASEPAREASWLYAREIVDGIVDHREEIDELIETYSQGWTLSRMPVEAAKILSTDDSAGFVNGLLGRIAQTAPSS